MQTFTLSNAFQSPWCYFRKGVQLSQSCLIVLEKKRIKNDYDGVHGTDLLGVTEIMLSCHRCLLLSS